METIEFLVQGSAAEPYKVSFQRVDQHLAAFCTCQAGKSGQYCKHRLSILNGSAEGVVSANNHQVGVVASWLPGSDLQAALADVEHAEGEFNRTKKALENAKKKVAAIMRA
ncbi:MAG: SWIM zinc finger family protein [Nevskiales bacterium]